MATSLPPPPPGYALDNLPPPPSGYKLDGDDNAPPQPQGSVLSRFAHAAWDTAKGMATALNPEQITDEDVAQRKAAGVNVITGKTPKQEFQSAPIVSDVRRLTSGDVAGELGSLAPFAAGGLAKFGADVATKVDPHVAALRAWGMNKDPRVLDQISNGDIKLTSGLSDLKAQGPIQGPYANEAVLKSIPQAKTANRSVWNQWMSRAAGQSRLGEPIVQATEDSLKNTISDQRAQAILADARRTYGRPLSPADLEALLEQKNGELQSFYSQSPEARGAAERAGADTLKSKALLEAQARAIRDTLYGLLDPENGGAGPREIQQRFGALKAIEDAANGRRTDIIGEHPVTPLESAANIKLDPRAAIKARQGSSEWLIEHGINASPDATPLPQPFGMYPQFGERSQLTAGAPRIQAPNTSGVSQTGMPPGPQQNVWEGIGAPKQLPAGRAPFTQGTSVPPDITGKPGGYNAGFLPPGSPARGQGVTVVPPPGGPLLSQPLEYPPGKVGAPPADTSGSIAQRLGKTVWNALGGPPVE